MLKNIVFQNPADIALKNGKFDFYTLVEHQTN